LKRVRIVRTSSTSSKPNLISRIEMFGVFGVDSGCPIAAEGVLRQGGRPQPLVRFPVAIGRNVCVVGPGFSRTDAFLGPVANIDRIRTWKYIVADFRPYGTVALPDSLADGAGAGQVDFEPSRIVARRARLFDRYWGKALRFAVELVISTGE
jgi:hypothetical protein